jgi:hypothetical protein
MNIFRPVLSGLLGSAVILTPLDQPAHSFRVGCLEEPRFCKQVDDFTGDSFVNIVIEAGSLHSEVNFNDKAPK